MTHFARSSNQSARVDDVRPNEAWREKVVQWNYRLIDHYQEPREIVYVSMNVLDRFVSSRPSCWDNNESYRLAAMTSLYVAMKRCGRSHWFRSQLLTKMSRGGVSQEDVSRMEHSITTFLSTRPDVPTPMQFVRAMLELLPPAASASMREAVLESAAFLVEISVCDPFFSCKSPAVLAFAALLQSLETHRASRKEELLPAFLVEVERLTELTPELDEVTAVSSRLRRLFARSREGSDSSAPHIIPADDDDESKSPPLRTAPRPPPIAANQGSPQEVAMSATNGATWMTTTHVVECKDDEKDGSEEPAREKHGVSPSSPSPVASRRTRRRVSDC